MGHRNPNPEPNPDPKVDAVTNARTPSWIPDHGQEAALGQGLHAVFSPEASDQLDELTPADLDLYSNVQELQAAILEVVAIDIRSVHKRATKGGCDEHRFSLDNLVVSFTITDSLAQISNIELVRSLSLIHISEPTRLLSISYAVFCLKKKKIKHTKNKCRITLMTSHN
eukprot:TRINITY_DN44806_c0_g1_i2.p2 TRINITY_DN44806_c0_g1~~TRINITY_DN44806_c0_g1_i2.p2  ORF type:complete len:169 (+),score=11.73 TRINITY_DN44806_c0_g1_i2:511-1017(+)